MTFSLRENAGYSKIFAALFRFTIGKRTHSGSVSILQIGLATGILLAGAREAQTLRTLSKRHPKHPIQGYPCGLFSLFSADFSPNMGSWEGLIPGPRIPTRHPWQVRSSRFPSPFADELQIRLILKIHFQRNPEFCRGGHHFSQQVPDLFSFLLKTLYPNGVMNNHYDPGAGTASLQL